MSAFGIPLTTGSGQQCMPSSQGAERSAACIFAHINLQILYPYVVIYRAGTVPGLQVRGSHNTVTVFRGLEVYM
jgi:hypothetical protein